MKNPLLILAILIMPFYLVGQDDTYTADTSKSGFTEKYNYLIRAKEEKTQMWKLTPVGSLGFGKTMFTTSSFAGFEKKFTRSLSLNTEVGLNHLFIFREGTNEYVSWLSASAGPRYYYNINRRIRLGKSANNFSANYFSAVVNFAIPNTAYLYSFSALYGLQRRIGDRYFIDVGVGPQVMIRQNTFDFLTDFRLRIGWGL